MSTNNESSELLNSDLPSDPDAKDPHIAGFFMHKKTGRYLPVSNSGEPKTLYASSVFHDSTTSAPHVAFHSFSSLWLPPLVRITESPLVF